eukprot:g47216.t1
MCITQANTALLTMISRWPHYLLWSYIIAWSFGVQHSVVKHTLQKRLGRIRRWEQLGSLPRSRYFLDKLIVKHGIAWFVPAESVTDAFDIPVDVINFVRSGKRKPSTSGIRDASGQQERPTKRRQREQDSRTSTSAARLKRARGKKNKKDKKNRKGKRSKRPKLVVSEEQLELKEQVKSPQEEFEPEKSEGEAQQTTQTRRVRGTIRTQGTGQIPTGRDEDEILAEQGNVQDITGFDVEAVGSEVPASSTKRESSGLRFYQGGRDWAPEMLAEEDLAWKRCISRNSKQQITKTPEESPAQKLARERCERAGITKMQLAQDLDFPSLPELYHGERVYRQTIAKLQQYPRLRKTITSKEELQQDFFSAPAAAPHSCDGWAEYDRFP